MGGSGMAENTSLMINNDDDGNITEIGATALSCPTVQEKGHPAPTRGTMRVIMRCKRRTFWIFHESRRMERVTESEGCCLSYDVSGQGRRVLFIQGVGVHGRGWRPQTDELAAHCACLTFDNRGLGRSVPAGRPVTVDRMADDARAVLDAVGWDQAHVVGHSLGGLVALNFALRSRHRVQSLSLLCTFANGRSAAPLTWRMIRLGLRARVGTRGMRRKGFLGIVLPPGAAADSNTAERLAEIFGHDLADQPPIVNEQLKAMRAADLSPRLGELSGLPTLVVSATHDPIAPPAAGRALARGITGAKYVEIASASHGLPITHAQEVNRILLNHFAAAEENIGHSAC